jgi:hypothetical protein
LSGAGKGAKILDSALDLYVSAENKDKKYAVPLSGGLDSRLILAHLLKRCPKRNISIVTFERTQVISDIRPHAFGSVRVNFSNAVSVTITCPFVFGMTNGQVLSNDVVVRFPFIGIASRLLQDKAMNVRFQRFSVCVVNHT